MQRRKGLTDRFCIIKRMIVFLSRDGYVISAYYVDDPTTLLKPFADPEADAPITNLTKDGLRMALNRNTAIMKPVATITDLELI